MKFFKKMELLFVVFLTGACVLAIELVATRILSPYFGNTIFTVSSVISVVLAALSIGYYFGGKLADKYPSEKIFYSIILLSGLSVLLLQILNLKLLPIIGYTLPIMLGPLVSSVSLFFLPSFLLGLLSPYAIKLQEVKLPDKGIGSISGEIFFWSTFGSIFGSITTGFFLIPKFGINQIVLTVGVLLCLLGMIPLIKLGVSKKKINIAIFLFLLSFFLGNIFEQKVKGNVIFMEDGVYERLTIMDQEYKNKEARFFFQDKSNSGAMFINSDEHVYDYTKYYSLYKIFNPQPKSTLVIGGGIYTIPKTLKQELPDAIVDVVEIEPSLFELSKEYFNLTEAEKINNYITDGRRFLHDSENKYDFIFTDAYYSIYSIPTHFTTREFFQLVKEKLNDEGLIVGNFIGSLARKEPSFMFSAIKTFRETFPNSYFFAVESNRLKETQNIIFVGYKSDKKIEIDSELLDDINDEFLSNLDEHLINIDRFDLANSIVFTDNYAPVDYMIYKAFKYNLAVKTKPILGEEMMAILSQIMNFGPRYIGSTGHTKMQDFLKLEMYTLSGDVYTQNWSVQTSDNKGSQMTNIIAKFFPEKENRIILGTHYDSKRYAESDKTDRYGNVPGANDSGSGVAMLLELASYFTNAGDKPNIGVDIVFFDGEEGIDKFDLKSNEWQPLGSVHFAENIDEIYPDRKPNAAIIFDMVCDKKLNISKEKSSVDNASELVNNFWEAARKIDKKVFNEDIIGAIRDDHTQLNEIGIPSILVIDFDYPEFHTTEDNIEKCSGKSMETVGTAVLEYLYSI
ncbi:MAG: fused MFS/spermidine synthase [bacterium]|nr:fused MFS/spermidine synthase [bacterium]